MNDNFYQIGHTLKKIRTDKGYTQEEIAYGKMSRSNYTKVEKDEINPSVVKFFAILDQMDMSAAEFSFILNDCTLNKKETIMYLFKNMSQSPSPTYLKELIDHAKAFLTEQNDRTVQDIIYLALAYTGLIAEHNLEKAQRYAAKVWEHLEKCDKFYLTEYHLLNRILYFFDLETAVSLTNKALKDLQSYKTFKEADILKLSFLSNIICILIDSGQHSRALVYTEHLIAESIESHQIVDLGAALVRKGMILKEVGYLDSSDLSFNSAINIFEHLGLDEYVRRTLKNPKVVHNPFGYVDLKKS